ncbi:MAG: preprotein translocase subunit SecA [Candidatus Gracilibacteria bacterium]|jgi:preprotein translocase subunit SecA
MLVELLEKIVGTVESKAIKKAAKLVEKINEIELEYQQRLTNEDIPKKTEEFRARAQNGESLDSLLPEAFALVKNAARRLVGTTWKVRGFDYTWDMVPFDVQLIGGIVLHEGNISEMKTGEGKTLVCTLAVYLNALAGKGVHVVTVNDYLAQRDSEWMGGLYNFLGMSVGVVIHGQNPDQKRAAYGMDITYGTNNEFGFDYLRDNMAPSARNLVQRDLFYAIVDEVDSILIDEARTPLIISAPAEESTEKYALYNRLVKMLSAGADYNVDEKQKVATLTEEGIRKMEDMLGVENIYTEKGFEEVHHIEQALRANALYRLDVDYMIQNGEIVIVDEFTGRLMQGRRFGQGLHQAIEAKEGVEIKRESKTLATITFQNYFRMYEKLAGMTGTAKTEAEEFASIYGLDVMQIPTHRPVIRIDKADSIYKNERSKFHAIANQVKELREKGQPVLIGTISVEKSERLSVILESYGIPHNVLNAKHHEREAEIVSGAGQRGAVTIATNMAGRGTDIKLGEGVKELGGLVILGSERHESRRIDNQLRGRSGRQGDPGMSQFFVSMEDDLMRIFGGDKMRSLMESMGLPEDMPIQNGIISRSIESAQKKVEGHNFDIRKHLVDYDSVMNTHRDIMYKRRRALLMGENMKNEVILLMENEVEKIVLSHVGDAKEIWETISAIHRDPVGPIALESLTGLSQEALIDTLKKYLEKEYAEKEKTLPSSDIMRQAERAIMLRVIDMFWMRHIDELKDLREAVSLSGYGQRNPLVEYKNQAFQMFEDLMSQVDRTILTNLFHVKVNVQLVAHEPAAASASASATSGPAASNSAATTSFSTSSVTSQNALANASATSPHAPGRNDPCPCGSGKKYKKCHGA